jgi:hypothetical protein
MRFPIAIAFDRSGAGVITLPLATGDWIVNLAGDARRLVAFTGDGERWTLVLLWKLVIAWRTQ